MFQYSIFLFIHEGTLYIVFINGAISNFYVILQQLQLKYNTKKEAKSNLKIYQLKALQPTIFNSH